MPYSKKPFTNLGEHLKTVREQAKRSLAEVSGAVEIDVDQLKLFEEGMKRPDEDVMLLLISYFNMADQEALHLWELAKYDSNLNEHLDLAQATDEQVFQQMGSAKPMIMLLSSLDVRTMYSDGVEVNWNSAGITISFNQANSKTQNLTVAKVGMSHKQVEVVIKCLQSALLHAKYNGSTKLLPPSTN
jgi:transcriptional regulator with XRE-family HTH domain